MDINLPEIDGFNCLKAFGEKTAFLKPPVVMFSGSTLLADVERAYRFGATLFLQKPPTYEKVVRAFRCLFALDWKEPERIASSHFTGERFVPFSYE